MGWRASGTALAVERSAAAIALDVYLQDGGVMNEAVDGGERHGLIAEHLGMPRRLIGESLGSRSLTRSIPCMAIAIRSASGALGGDRR